MNKKITKEKLETYEVIIQAKMIKTITVKAKNEDEAIEKAHQKFEPGHQRGIPEDYDETWLEVTKI